MTGHRRRGRQRDPSDPGRGPEPREDGLPPEGDGEEARRPPPAERRDDDPPDEIIVRNWTY